VPAGQIGELRSYFNVCQRAADVDCDQRPNIRDCVAVAGNELITAQFAIHPFETPTNCSSLLLPVFRELLEAALKDWTSILGGARYGCEQFQFNAATSRPGANRRRAAELPLKLYNHSRAPNPRRLRIFAAEKAYILAEQSRTPGFLTINSSGAVPGSFAKVAPEEVWFRMKPLQVPADCYLKFLRHAAPGAPEISAEVNNS
jgi:hypothetical protein